MTGFVPTFCLDFDGVIHSYTSGWKGSDVIPDEPVPGAFDFIREAMDSEVQVVVFSSRSHADDPFAIAAMADWFVKHGMEISRIDWNDLSKRGILPTSHPFHNLNRFERDHTCKPHPRPIQFPTAKPAAFISIDDRGLLFTGDWSQFRVEELKRFKPWNK